MPRQFSIFSPISYSYAILPAETGGIGMISNDAHESRHEFLLEREVNS